MSDEKDIQNYRKEKSLELITKYKDLIDKTFTVIDLDGLDEEINNADEETKNEESYLKRIKLRKQSLDEVVSMVEKIEELERHTKDDTPTSEGKTEAPPSSTVHPSKRHARK